MEHLDDIDRLLLGYLGQAARATNAELADRVHMSQSATLRRVRRLENEGIIESYSVVANRSAIGRGTSVFVEITLNGQSDSQLDEFEAAIADCPDVLSCHLIAGGFDYLVHVACDDVTSYESIHRRQLAHLPHVARVQSSFALRTVLDRPATALL
jgi:DNA-binding Lrp family transcriptional regulator|tara:strand:- start:5699 stop:6163 length:465 start_codon:yes stop_codon:yes gene_type:complete